MNNYEQDIKDTVSVLKDGGVILYPTDTIWGLGCDASNEKAIQKIIQIKHRDANKSFVLLMTDLKQLYKYIANPLPHLQEIVKSFQTPTTLIYPGAINLPSCLFGPDGSIAVRITKDTFCRSLIKRLRQPIVSTSANLSGEPSPNYFQMVTESIHEQVDYVVQFRQDDRSIQDPSTILKLCDDGTLLRIR